MKPFQVKIPLRVYVEHNGKLTQGQKLICVDHYECVLLKTPGKRFKMVYVEFENDRLYPKGTRRKLYFNEVHVPLEVLPVTEI